MRFHPSEEFTSVFWRPSGVIEIVHPDSCGVLLRTLAIGKVSVAGRGGRASAECAVHLNQPVLGIVVVVMHRVLNYVPGCIVLQRAVVDVVVVVEGQAEGRASRACASQVLLPPIAVAVIAVGVSEILGGVCRGDQAVEIVIRVSPVAVGAVVRAEDITVRSIAGR